MANFISQDQRERSLYFDTSVESLYRNVTTNPDVIAALGDFAIEATDMLDRLYLANGHSDTLAAGSTDGEQIPVAVLRPGESVKVPAALQVINTKQRETLVKKLLYMGKTHSQASDTLDDLEAYQQWYNKEVDHGFVVENNKSNVNARTYRVNFRLPWTISVNIDDTHDLALLSRPIVILNIPTEDYHFNDADAVLFHELSHVNTVETVPLDDPDVFLSQAFRQSDELLAYHRGALYEGAFMWFDMQTLVNDQRELFLRQALRQGNVIPPYDAHPELVARLKTALNFDL